VCRLGHEVAKQLLAAADSTGSVSDEHGAYKLLGMIALRERDFAAAERYGRRTLEAAQALGDEIDLVLAKLNLAVPIMDSGRIEAAVPMFEDVLAHYRRNGNAEGVGLALLNLGEAAYLLEEYARASECWDEARTAFGSIGFRAHVGHALRGLAACEARFGRYDDAARLLAQADVQLEEVGASEDDFIPGLADEVATEARSQLGEAAFAAAYEDGKRTSSVPSD
jgi:tetratricopeptide (TPR) repeat protein